MAATIAVSKHAGKQPSAPNIQVFFDFTGDASYPTGGYDFEGEGAGSVGAAAFLQQALGYDKAPDIGMVIGEPKGNFLLVYNRATDKLQLFLVSTGAEVAATTDVSVTPGLMRGKIEAC